MTDLALTLMKIFEGFKPRAYLDVGDKGTIGYGHLILPGEDWSKGITPEDAETLLRKDFAKHEAAVIRSLEEVHALEHELEAMSSLCFNIGPARFGSSTLLVRFKCREYQLAAWEFLKWKYAGGQPKLLRRRHIESCWFLGAAPETLLDYVRR